MASELSSSDSVLARSSRVLPPWETPFFWWETQQSQYEINCKACYIHVEIYNQNYIKNIRVVILLRWLYIPVVIHCTLLAFNIAMEHHLFWSIMMFIIYKWAMASIAVLHESPEGNPIIPIVFKLDAIKS